MAAAAEGHFCFAQVVTEAMLWTVRGTEGQDNDMPPIEAILVPMEAEMDGLQKGARFILMVLYCLVDSVSC
jgi:hypothetical protein